MKFAHYRTIRHAACMIMLAAFAINSLGQKQPVSGIKAAPAESAAPNASVPMVKFDNDNMDCAGLNALHVNGVGDLRFSHILDSNSMKLDFGTPNGTFPFTNGSGREVIGPQYANLSLTVASSGSTIASWSSQLPVTAVIIKAGNDSFVWPYKPFSFGDTNLAAGVQQNISHLTFCTGEPTGPTAGEVSISGRVVDASGIGIAKAQMIVINGSTGESKITMTNPFGYYSIPNLDVNELYILNVSHKRYVFAESQRVVVPGDHFTAPDFVANPF